MSGNIDPVLPFISHTGVNLPEAAPFTLVHSISAVCAGLIIYIRVAVDAKKPLPFPFGIVGNYGIIKIVIHQ